MESNGMSRNWLKTCKNIEYDKAAILNQWGKTDYFVNDAETPTNWAKKIKLKPFPHLNQDKFQMNHM